MRFWSVLKILVMTCIVSGALYVPTHASYLTVDILSLTLPARSLPDLTLPRISADGYSHLPFYFRVNFSKNNNMNWAIELYSNNSLALAGTGSQTPADGIYRGWRNESDVNQSIPLYWQVYDYDLNVAATYGTPTSITMTAGYLGINSTTYREYWGDIFDIRDSDKNPTGQDDDLTWNLKSERDKRLIVDVRELGDYPREGRPMRNDSVYLYFAGDFSSVGGESRYIGNLRMDYIYFPFDVTEGCFATPNPVKPALGERVYFNFFTNSPDSNVTIKIYDPTGFPVVTLRNTRYWDCRNSNYQFVEGGLYLYQIEVEGHRLSGTVVVIK